MNKDLIKERLVDFSSWLKNSSDIELMASSMMRDNLPEKTRHLAAAHAYNEAWDLFLDIKDHIERLLEDTNERL